MKKPIFLLAVLLALGMLLGAPALAQDIRGAELRLVVREKPVPPKNPDEVSDAVKELPTAGEYDKLTDEEKEAVKEKVDSIVEGIENLPLEEQAKIPQKDIEKLGELYDKIYNVTIHKDTSAAEGLKTRVPEKDIQVFGAGMAAAALGGDVKITIVQDLPPDGAVMAFTLELFLKKDGEAAYTKVELRTPLVIKLRLPDSVKAQGLTIRHIKADGSTEILPPEINGRIASFMPTSFSNFLFIEAQGPGPAPTPRPNTPTGLQNAGQGTGVLILVVTLVAVGAVVIWQKR